MGEERSGLLNNMLEGITSLNLRGHGMFCSDIASPSLRCLTVIFPMAALPGAGRRRLCLSRAQVRAR